MRRTLVIEICSVPLDKVRKFAHILPWRMLTSPSSWILNRWRCCPLENRGQRASAAMLPRSPTFSVSEVPFGWFPPPLQTEEQVQPDNSDCQESCADCREILDHSPLLRFRAQLKRGRRGFVPEPRERDQMHERGNFRNAGKNDTAVRVPFRLGGCAAAATPGTNHVIRRFLVLVRGGQLGQGL